MKRILLIKSLHSSMLILSCLKNISAAHLKLLEQLDVLIRGCAVVGRLSAVGTAAAPPAPARLPALPRLPSVLLPDPVNLVVHLVVCEPDRTSTVCNTGTPEQKKKPIKDQPMLLPSFDIFMLTDTGELVEKMLFFLYRKWCFK
jgi:hypothetical protein